MEEIRMTKKSEIRMNIGGASVLLLISVLALTIFAVLSIRASHNELEMAERMREAVEAYYKADRIAGSIYTQLYAAWEDLQEDARENAGLVWERAADSRDEKSGDIRYVEKKTLDGDRITYEVCVDYNRTLVVTAGFHRDACGIESYELKSSVSGSYEGEMLDIWDGVANP